MHQKTQYILCPSAPGTAHHAEQRFAWPQRRRQARLPCMPQLCTFASRQGLCPPASVRLLPLSSVNGFFFSSVPQGAFAHFGPAGCSQGAFVHAGCSQGVFAHVPNEDAGVFPHFCPVLRPSAAELASGRLFLLRITHAPTFVWQSGSGHGLSVAHARCHEPANAGQHQEKVEGTRQPRGNATHINLSNHENPLSNCQCKYLSSHTYIETACRRAACRLQTLVMT